MALEDTPSIISYAGNDSTVTAYPLPFVFFSDDDIALYVDGVLSVDTFSIIGDKFAGTASAVTDVAYTSNPEQTVTFQREVSYDQPTVLPGSGRTDPTTLERAYDYLSMQIQQVAREVEESPKAAPGDTTPGGSFSEAANTTVGQDANGDLVMRSAAEEVAFLGIGTSVDAAVASAAAALVSETNAATSETNAAASEANAAASEAAALDALDAIPASLSASNTFTIATNDAVGSILLTFDGGGVFWAGPGDQDEAAQSLADLINAGVHPVTATATGNILRVVAKLPGDDGNGISCVVVMGGGFGSWAGPETTGGSISNLVLTSTQSLTSTQKAQARENIGIGDDDALSAPRIFNSQRVLANLHLPNYDYEQSTLHCDLLRFEGLGKFGWRYWMVHTPIYGVTQANPLEFPVVCVSADGENWQLPEGGPSVITTSNPATLGGLSYQHAADTCIVETAAGNLRVYWIHANDDAPRRHCIRAMETADGINWIFVGGTDGFLLYTEDHNLTSPTVVREDDNSYTMFVGKTTSGARGYAYRTSADGLTWSAETVCNMPTGYRGWHTAVRKKAGVYYMLAQNNHAVAGRSSAEFRAYQSSDKLNWTEITGGLVDSSFHDDYVNWNKDLAGGGIYRGCHIVNDDGTWDIWMSTLVSDGVGNGDSSGDSNVAPGVYRATRISLARNVDVKKRTKFVFEAAPNHEAILASRLTPVIEKAGQLTEFYTPVTTRRGWKWEWGTPFAGLLSGTTARIHPANKPNALPGTNKGLGIGQGEIVIAGVLGSTPLARHAISGSTTTTTLSNTGNSLWSGNNTWTIITTIVNGSPDVNLVLAEGDVIVGATSGATAVIHYSVQTGRVIYPKNPSGTVIFQTGEPLTVNGTPLTDNGVDVTISSFVGAPVASGINVLYHHYVGSKGGYCEVWNNSTSTFHGLIRYQSFR
jgi:hypothetical protein